MPDWLCNEVNYTTFDFSRFANLEHLEIGSESFGFVDTFILDGFNNMTTLKIGSYSFTESKYAEDNRIYKSFHVKNCDSLESIEIADDSFSDYAGEFELVNLPSLQSINMGSEYGASYNFYHSSFVVRGITDIFSYNNLDLPSLKSIMLGMDAFHESLNTIIESLHITLMQHS